MVSGLLEDLTEPRAVGETLLSALFDVMATVGAKFLRRGEAGAQQLSRADVLALTTAPL